MLGIYVPSVILTVGRNWKNKYNKRQNRSLPCISSRSSSFNHRALTVRQVISEHQKWGGRQRWGIKSLCRFITSLLHTADARHHHWKISLCGLLCRNMHYLQRLGLLSLLGLINKSDLWRGLSMLVFLVTQKMFALTRHKPQIIISCPRHCLPPIPLRRRASLLIPGCYLHCA